MMVGPILLALLAAVLFVVSGWLVAPALGLAVAGVCSLIAGYVWAYLMVRGGVNEDS